jgi:type II secretory pathway pseudopilin PulG
MPNLVSGFTLIELMVAFAIIIVISAVVLTNQSSFNKTLILANTAYDIALTLRAAETYGIGSRAAGVSANAGYGLNFQKAKSDSFTLFADAYPAPSTLSVCHPTNDASAPDARPGNCVYESSQGEKVLDYVLGNGITVSDFCAYALGNWSCAYAQGGALSSLDIVFARPNPDPFISTNGSYSADFPATAACIAITSPHGGAHFISIAASGQIIATAASCP